METEEKLSYVQYTDFTERMHKADEALERLSLRWSTLHKVRYYKRKETENEVPDIGEWSGIKQFRSILGRVGVVRRNYPIEPLVYPS